MQEGNIHLLLHPYFDGELEFSESIRFEEHLKECSDCSMELDEQRKLRSTLEQSALGFAAPQALRQRIQLSFLNSARSPKAASGWSWKAYGIAASIALAFFVTWIFFPKGEEDHETAEAAELVSAHVRSLMATHLFDVASTDQHTVKPWFAGKLDFSPVVKDFAAQGFQLIGGRLDYIGERPVAALIYQHEKHIINVFEWSVNPARPEKHIVLSKRGYNLIGDGSGELRLWLVSDLNAEELGQLANLLK